MRAMIAEEEEHESRLMQMVDEERLHYVGSIVLGLNDALVELTGTIAGLSFAMQNTGLVALSGIITGVSATLSMAARVSVVTPTVCSMSAVTTLSPPVQTCSAVA